MEIYNSTVNLVTAYKGGLVYLENCRIIKDIEVKDANSKVYGYGLTGSFQGDGDLMAIRPAGAARPAMVIGLADFLPQANERASSKKKQGAATSPL